MNFLDGLFSHFLPKSMLSDDVQYSDHLDLVLLLVNVLSLCLI